MENDLNTIEMKVKETRKPVSAVVPVRNFKREAGEAETGDTRNLSNKDLLDQQHA
jgi:hypothetical protein